MGNKMAGLVAQESSTPGNAPVKTSSSPDKAAVRRLEKSFTKKLKQMDKKYEMAMMAQSGGKGYYGGGKGGYGKYGGGKGKGKLNYVQKPYDKSHIKCFKCGKPGHKAATCRVKP